MELRQHLPLCLASSSPQRRSLLATQGVRFLCWGPQIDERPARGEPARAYVLRLAREKAAAGRKQHPQMLILAADTVVALGAQILGKPGTAAEAEAMLRKLCGSTHRVYTAYCLWPPGAGAPQETEALTSGAHTPDAHPRAGIQAGAAVLDTAVLSTVAEGVAEAAILRVVETHVRFRHMPESWLRAYVRDGEPMGKAGAYAVQGCGAALVESICGSWANVVGLPIEVVMGDLLARSWVECCA